MNINDIKKLVAILEDSDVTELQWDSEGSSLKISRGSNASPVVYQAPAAMPVATGPLVEVASAGAVPASAPQEAAASNELEGLEEVPCPVVGTFYRRPSPDSDPFVDAGAQVSKGDTLCIVEAMKVMNEVEAPCEGTIEKVLVADGAVVEFGEPLFLIRPL